MNGINLTLDTNDFLKVCNKIKNTRDCRIKESILFKIMVAGRMNDKISTYVNYDQDKMNGCVILALQEDITGDLTLVVVYLFIDKHYPELTSKYIQLIEEKARGLRADKIVFTTHRNPKVIERKYGNLGYKHRCSVIEKRIKEVV